jgi:hypothetical protein
VRSNQELYIVPKRKSNITSERHRKHEELGTYSRQIKVEPPNEDSGDQGTIMERGHDHSQKGRIWFSSSSKSDYMQGVQKVPKYFEKVMEPFPSDTE